MTTNDTGSFSSSIKKSGFVTVVGRPNVGKSTLINRIVGQKVAIVTDKPQTTRNRILAIANLEQAQIVFYDTPGIHKPMHRMNQVMVDLARESLSLVDLVVLVVDITQPFGAGDVHVLKMVRRVKKPTLLAINKVDTVKKEEALPVIAEYSERHSFEAIVPISAKDGDNVDRLVELLASRLPDGPALFPEEMITDAPERFFVCEIVREKIVNLTREEIPYSSAVSIDRWADSEDDGLIRIEASILVERDSQKGILLGKKGSMIKRIGTEARKEIEHFLGSKVFLGLHVKVSSDWRESPRVLGDLGIKSNQ